MLPAPTENYWRMKMSTNQKLALLIGTVLGLAAAQNLPAAELVAYNVAEAKGGRHSNTIQLELNTPGNVSGFNFAIQLGISEGMKVDLSDCVSALPAGFSGECRLNGGVVNFFAMADGMTTLPAGEVTIGSISFSGPYMAKLRGSATITGLEMVDVEGNPISATAVLD